MLSRRTWNASSRPNAPERVGPYTVYGEIGHGGMATVHLGQLKSASGFTRTVAIKRLHPNLAKSPEFVAMFVDEAKLAGRIQHPNVVSAIDCVADGDSILLVMDYVHGVSLDQALRAASKSGHTIPLPIASAIIIGALLGLHAAHEAVDEHGRNLSIVHRDASPHNILVGVDGLARVLDFGIAKAAERAHYTRTGEVKGKLAYMAPEQFFHEPTGRETDVYSVGVVLWELVTGRRLFAGDTQAQTLMRVTNGQIEAPRTVAPDVPPEVEAIVMKALSRAPTDRFRTALEFAVELERCIPPAPQRVVGEWLATVGKPLLVRRLELKSELEGTGLTHGPWSAPTEADDIITSRFTLPAPPMVPAEAAGFADGARGSRSRRSRSLVLSTLIAAAVVTAATFAWSRFSAPDRAAQISAARPTPAAEAEGAASPSETPAATASGSAIGSPATTAAERAGTTGLGPSPAAARLPRAAATVAPALPAHSASPPLPMVRPPPPPVARAAGSAAPGASPVAPGGSNSATARDPELEVIGGRE